MIVLLKDKSSFDGIYCSPNITLPGQLILWCSPQIDGLKFPGNCMKRLDFVSCNGARNREVDSPRYLNTDLELGLFDTLRYSALEGWKSCIILLTLRDENEDTIFKSINSTLYLMRLTRKQI